MIDITQIALALIAVVGTVITAVVIPVLKTKLTNDQLSNLYSWVRIAVQAAEQLCLTAKLDPNNRKQYVFDFLQEHGFTIDIEKVNDMIESIVYELPPTNINELLTKSADDED